MLKVVIAPSGFKESLSAEEAARIIARGVRNILPDAEITEVPLGDGGEGFTRTMMSATGGKIHKVPATGPTGKPIESHFGIFTDDDGKKVAVLEMAAAAGLSLVPKDQRNPFETTTYGVGELIKAALDAGVDKILVGNGDSGTNDGGAGAAQALGVKLLKENGDDIERSGTGLKELAKVDLSGRDERLDKVQIDVACNIKNILCGEKGVARVFGPQKGATDEQVEEMSDTLDNYAEIIKRDTGKDVAEMPGGGASGGLGAGLHALLGAELHSRFDIVFKYFKLDEALENADLVITAEGGLNFQTPNGKIPSEVARRAKERNLPVLAIAGSLNKGARDNYEIGIDALFSILREPCTLEEAIEHAPELLEKCAENVMRTLLVGKALGGKMIKTLEQQNAKDAERIERG
ncbi:MAG: glycerate kinase [Acidobacteriota bacterium]|nr:glycerate kinase [Acidobacteriota bacterium]